jgi:imidazolonepropionase-like amidohydrolase
MPRTLFSNVMIFEGTEKDLRPGEVLVQGNRIQAVAGPGETLTREGCQVIDAGGATLMPGMVNTHAHLTYNNGTTVAELTGLPVEEHVLLSMHNAKLDLDVGFTAAIGAPRPSRGSTSSSATKSTRERSRAPVSSPARRN